VNQNIIKAVNLRQNDKKHTYRPEP